MPTISIIARQHTDARYWYSNSVCLFVRPSVRNTLVLYENGDFLPISRYISQTIQDIYIVTIEGE